MFLNSNPAACLGLSAAPSSVDLLSAYLSIRLTSAHSLDAESTSLSGEGTASRSFDATLTPLPNYSATGLTVEVNPASSTIRQRIDGDAPLLASLSSNQSYVDVAPTAPRL